MNKKVNISAIKSKMHFIYKDEREKNIAAIVIYNKDGEFFFDPEYKNKMSNLEVEALLLRGALVDRGGKYYRPSSFNENNVSFSDAVVNPEDIEVDLSGYVTKDEMYNIKNKITLDPPEIKHIAHRGYSFLAPENTMPAYEQAALYGFWGAEADIQETSDGCFILMHDDTVDRTTNGSGKVAEMSLSQIQSLTVDAGSNIANYPNLKVPTFEEFLICCKTNGMVPVIEIKHINNMDGFLNILQKHNMIDHSIVISFDVYALIELRECNPDIRIQTLSNLSIDDLKKYNFDIDICATDATANIGDLTEMAHSQGLKVNCWNVNDASILEQLTDIGVDFITTDGLFSNNMKRYNKVLECEKEIGGLKRELQALKELLSSIPNAPSLSYVVNEFVPSQIIYTGKFPDNRPILEVGTTSRFRSTCEITKLTDKFKLSFDNGIYQLAVQMFDEIGNLIFDSGYLSPGKEVICPPENSAVSNVIIFGMLSSGAIITQEHLDNLNDSNITLEFIPTEEYSILNTEYYTDDYSLSVDDFGYASGLNGYYPYPSSILGTTNPSNRVGCTTKVFKANKIKITFNAEYNVTLVPLSSRGVRVIDLGWLISGNTYDMTEYAAFAIYASTKTGNFDDNTLAELVNSIVIEVVE